MWLCNREQINFVWATVYYLCGVNLACITLSKEGEYDYLSVTT